MFHCVILFISSSFLFFSLSTSDSSVSIISFFHSSGRLDRGFLCYVVFLFCLVVIQYFSFVNVVGYTSRDRCFQFNFFRYCICFLLLSHLILIVFPLIVFTYTVMLFSSGSSSSPGGKREDVGVELVFFDGLMSCLDLPHTRTK